MFSLFRSTSDSSSFTISFNSKPSESLASSLVWPITFYHQSVLVSAAIWSLFNSEKLPLSKIPFSRTTAHIDESQTRNTSQRKEVSCQITLICINTVDCGIANLETGYPKPDSAGSGGPSGILTLDLQRVLTGLLSAIGLSWESLCV